MNCLKLMQARWLRLATCVALLTLCLGCDGTLTFAPFSQDAGESENGDSPSDPLPDEDPFLVVRVVNVSDLALDVQLFISDDPAITTAEQLFVEANALREGIGFLSMGILEAGEVVDVPVPCEEALFVGTQGGEFLDPVTGESIAEGTTPRLAQLGFQFDCGNRVSFTFSADPEGQPIATLGIK